MYNIEYADGIADDLAGMQAVDRSRILDKIEEQLTHEPNVATRNRKELPGLSPPWEHVPPVWELRVNEFRVFYDVSEGESLVRVRAIRHKPPQKSTEEVL